MYSDLERNRSRSLKCHRSIYLKWLRKTTEACRDSWCCCRDSIAKPPQRYRLSHLARVNILFKIHFNIIPPSQNLFRHLRVDSILWLYWPVGFVYPAESIGLGRSADSCIRSSWFEAGVSSGRTLSRSLTRHLNISHFHNCTLSMAFLMRIPSQLLILSTHFKNVFPSRALNVVDNCLRI